MPWLLERRNHEGIDGSGRLLKVQGIGMVIMFSHSVGSFPFDYIDRLFLYYRRPKLCHWGNIATQPSSRTPA